MMKKNLNYSTLNSLKLVIFSKWTRRHYSVFLSLHQRIKISVLPLTYFLLNTFVTLAQTDTIKIDEIRVSAYRNEVSFMKAARSVHLLSADEISEAPLISINDALKTMMNVDVRERGAFGVQSDLNIRGGSFEQNVVLINGFRMNDPQTGHFQMNLPIDLVDIQRIELLSGSASSLYGNNALSGAVNFITGLKEDSSMKFSTLYGEHDLYGANFSINLSSKKFKNYLSVSKRLSEGHIYNTDFDIFNLFYSGKLISNPGTLQFQAGILDKSFGANSFYSPKYPDQFEHNKTWMANIKFESNTKVKITPSLYCRKNFDKFELFRYDAPAWYTGHNYHTTDVFGAALNANLTTLIGQSAFGVEWNKECILSNKLGELLIEPKPVRGEDSVSYIYGKTRNNISMFFENHFECGKINISAQLMANRNSMFGWNFYPGIDVSYAVSERWRINASANWSGRLPSFTELYYSSPASIGNKALLPEKATTFDLGLKYLGNHFLLQTSIFYRDGRDIIDWVKENPDDLWQCNNMTNLKTYGFEFSGKWDFKSKYGQDYFLKSINFSYAYLTTNKNSEAAFSQYVLDYLKHSAGLGISHKLIDHISATWQFSYQLRNGSYLPYNQQTNLFESAKDYSPVYLIDLKFSYTIKALDFFVQVKNILDQQQQNIENVRLPGRWISGGFSLNLSLVKKTNQSQSGASGNTE